MEQGRVAVLFTILAATLPLFSVWPMQLMLPNDYVRATPQFLFTVLFLLTAGLYMMMFDRFLGIFVVYITIQSLLTQTDLSLAIAHWVALGAFGILLVRHICNSTIVKWSLITVAILQIMYATIQLFDRDPLYWSGPTPITFVHGTFGHHNFLGSYLAMLTPLVPFSIILIFIYGLILSNSFLSISAACVGILVNVKQTRYKVIGGLLTLLAIVLFFWKKSHDSLYTRIDAWTTALLQMDNSWYYLLFGYGTGSWYTNIPKLQIETNRIDIFYAAHNEYVQLFFETGLVGLGIFMCWLYDHRHALKNGSFVAVLLSCAGIYALHLASTAITAILITGMTTTTRKEEETWSRNSSAYYM